MTDNTLRWLVWRRLDRQVNGPAHRSQQRRARLTQPPGRHRKDT